MNRLIGKINDAEVNKITIPVTAKITGNLTSPNVKTDLTSGVKNLTQQLIEIEKQKLLNQGKDKVKDLITGVVGINKTKTDSVKQQQSNIVNDVLGDIVKGSSTKKDTDSTKAGSTVNNVKAALGNLFGTTKKKDTLN